MGDSLTLIDMFVRGIAVGAMIAMGAALLASAQARQARVTGSLLSLSIACWLITESGALWGALGHFYPLVVPAYAVGAFFWLFVITVFDDRPLSPVTWAPVALLMVTGVICELLVPPAKDLLWAARNVFSAALLIHASVVMVRGWSGDLLEARRRLRGPVMGFAAFFGLTNTIIALVVWRDLDDPLLIWTAGEVYGGAVFAAIVVAASVVFLQARPAALTVATRRDAVGADTRTDAAERMMLGRLNALMAAGEWRREGLTIGEIARQLGEPEHRLRRLINQRLGHRNFADFVNGYRIEAAKVRLADPRDARTTIAAIAFDVGYGSLGPFNRTFRAATGATPTEWRRQALQASPELQEAV